MFEESPDHSFGTEVLNRERPAETWQVLKARHTAFLQELGRVFVNGFQGLCILFSEPALRSTIGGCLILLTSLLLYLINPAVLISKYATRITKGSEVYKLLSGEIETIHISTYLFNVTNGERFLSGQDQKLKVREIGPFRYREIRINKNMFLDSENQLLHYNPATNFTLIRERSIADPADVNVTMPNVALLSMSSMVSHQSFWVKLPLNLLTSKQQSKAIVNMSAESYLWGYEEPLITFGNTVLPGWIFFRKLGLLDRFLDRERPYKLVVGAADHNKFQVKSMNGLNGLTAWGYGTESSNCNTFSNAYEGLGYPDEMTPKSRVRIFRKLLCRMLDLDYAGTVMTELGVQALKYQMGRDTFDLSGQNQCLCPKGGCIKGYYDVSPCFYDLPLAMSQAHFLDGDPRLFERIEGLSPDPKLHGSEVLIEPTCGVALKNTFTIQINVKVDDVRFNAAAKPFANMVVPIAWFKIEMPELLDDVVYNVKWIGNYGPKLHMATLISLTVCGILLIAYSVRFMVWGYCMQRTRMTYEYNIVPANGKEMKLIVRN